MAVSLVGDSVYGLVFLFMARKLSGSDAVTGLAAMAQALPFVVFGPLAGVVADRFDRKKVMVFADMGCAVVTLAVSLLAFFQPQVPVGVIIATGFLLSSITVFFMPARSAAIPALVPKEELQGANAFMVMTQQATAMVGLAVSFGVLGAIESFAPQAFFPLAAAVNSLTFLVSAIFIWRLPKLVPERDDLDAHSYGHFVADIKAGIQAVSKDALLRTALPLTAACHFVIAWFMIAYVAVNQSRYGGKFFTLGLVEFTFMVVMLGFGVVAGKSKLKHPGRIMAVAWFSVGFFCLLMTWGKSFGVFLLLNALCGVGIPFSWLALALYSQAGFPDEVRGRVNSLWSLVQQAAQPIGVVLAGPVISRWGVDGVFFIMGVVIMVACTAAFSVRGFRSVQMPSMGAEAKGTADLPEHEGQPVELAAELAES